MSTEQIDQEVVRMVDAASLPLRAGWRERAVDALSRGAREGARDRRRWLALAAGGTVVVAALALLLTARPTPAQAALERVIAAAKAVQTCRIAWRLAQPDGAETRRLLWYDEGRFRDEEWRNGKLETIHVYNDGRLDVYLPDANRLLQGVSDKPFATDFEGFTVAALINAEGDAAQVHHTTVPGADGRALDCFTITEVRGERIVVLADPATHLPLSIEYYAPLDDGWEKVGETESIEYDLQLDPALFVLAPPEGATVVDQQAASEEWQQRYDAGMMRASSHGHEAVLRDFQATTAGDVFAIWTTDPASMDRRASLRDSLGTVYVSESEYGHSGFQAWGKPCAWFIPVTPPSDQPAWYDLEVASDGDIITFHIQDPIRSGLDEPMYPAFRPRRGEAAFISPGGTYGPLARAEIRARYWRDRGDLQQALRYYEEMLSLAESQLSLQPSTWLDVASLYEQLGMRDNAHAAYERGIEAHRRDSNGANPDQIEVVKQLEQGLKRTR